ALLHRVAVAARGADVRISDGDAVVDHLVGRGVVADGHDHVGRALTLAVDRVAHIGVAATHRPGAIAVVGDAADPGLPIAPVDAGAVVSRVFRRPGRVARVAEGGLPYAAQFRSALLHRVAVAPG